MALFTYGKDYVEYRNGGETLWVMAWGENSLRVVSVPNGPLDMSISALLPQQPVEADITVNDDTAEITNGKITALFDTRGWNDTAVLTFYNEKK